MMLQIGGGQNAEETPESTREWLELKAAQLSRGKAKQRKSEDMELVRLPWSYKYPIEGGSSFDGQSAGAG